MKKTFLILIPVAVLFLIFMLPQQKEEQAHAKSIYVAPDGHDGAEGTKRKPLRTLAKASSLAKAGTTVYIREGNYAEQLVVQHSGTEEKPIVFKAYQDENVILSGKHLQDVEEETALIKIDSKNFIAISGLTLQELTTDLADETVMGIYVTGSSSHITLDGNHVHHIETRAEAGNGHGIAVYGTGKMTDINVVNNTVEDLTLGFSESIVLNGDIDGFKVVNNLVRRSDNIGIDLIGYEETALDKQHDYVRNGLVKNNTVYEVSSHDNPAYDGDYSAGGIYVDGGKRITIEKNTIYNCDIGVEATSEHTGKYAENIEIIDNIIYHNDYTGISIGGYDEKRGGTIQSTISHNILYQNDLKGQDGGQLLLQHDTRNNVIRKNILTAGPSRLFVVNYFSSNQHNKLRDNVFHKEQGKAGIWVWKEKEYTSFSKFQKASNSDESSTYIDPEYRNESDFDFELKPHSPVRGIVE